MTDDEVNKKLLEDSRSFITNMYWMYSGYLVTDGEKFAFCDEEGEKITHLPSFIKSKADAEKYIGVLQDNYIKGIKAGKNKFKRELKELISL